MAFNLYKPSGRRLVPLSVFTLLLTSKVAAQSEPIELEAQESSFSLQLPVSTFQEGQSLAVEIDGYDVTTFARIQEASLILEMDTPFQEGVHYLTVLLFLPNGNIETLVERSLSVTRTREASTEWYANSSFTSNYRAKEKDGGAYEGISSGSSNGSLEAASTTNAGDWQLSTRLQSIYDSAEENQPANHNRWLVPDYQVAAVHNGERVKSVFSVGNVLVEGENLLFSNFNRRGAAAEVTDHSGLVRFQVFGTKSEPTARSDGDYGIPERHERTSGASATFSLAEEHLQLSAGYVNGQTTLGGAGMGGFEDLTVYGGESWNMGVDSRWLQNSVWLHLEYAESRFDIDGLDVGLEAQNDNATLSLLQLSSEGVLSPGWFDYWTAQLRHQTVGRDFFSIGNLYLPGDLTTDAVQFQGNKGSVGIQADWSREKNNVDDDPLRPHQTMTRKGALVSYTSMGSEAFSQLWDVLGSPSANVGFYRTQHSQPRSDALNVGYDLDYVADETSLALNFSQATWNWGLQYQVVEQDDHSSPVIIDNFLYYQPPSDTENQLSSLLFGWNPGTRGSLNVAVQWNTMEELDTGSRFRTRNYNLDAYFQIVPDELTMIFNHNFGRNHSRYGLGFSDDSRSESGNLQLSWHAVEWRPQRPALNLYLKGVYGRQAASYASSLDEQWSVHLGIEIQFSQGEKL